MRKPPQRTLDELLSICRAVDGDYELEPHLFEKLYYGNSDAMIEHGLVLYNQLTNEPMLAPGARELLDGRRREKERAAVKRRAAGRARYGAYADLGMKRTRSGGWE